MKAAMIEGAGEVVALADHDKLGTAMPIVVAPLRAVTYLVTDADVDDEPCSIPRARDRGATGMNAPAFGAQAWRRTRLARGSRRCSSSTERCSRRGRRGSRRCRTALARPPAYSGWRCSPPRSGRWSRCRSSAVCCRDARAGCSARFALAGLMVAILLPGAGAERAGAGRCTARRGRGELDARPVDERTGSIGRAHLRPPDPVLAARRILIRRVRRRRPRRARRRAQSSRRSLHSLAPRSLFGIPGTDRHRSASGARRGRDARRADAALAGSAVSAGAARRGVLLLSDGRGRRVGLERETRPRRSRWVGGARSDRLRGVQRRDGHGPAGRGPTVGALGLDRGCCAAAARWRQSGSPPGSAAGTGAGRDRRVPGPRPGPRRSRPQRCSARGPTSRASRPDQHWPRSARSAISGSSPDPL